MSAVYKIPYEKSFASHPKAKFWHPTKNKDSKNNDIVPRGIRKFSNKKFWFIERQNKTVDKNYTKTTKVGF